MSSLASGPTCKQPRQHPMGPHVWIFDRLNLIITEDTISDKTLAGPSFKVPRQHIMGPYVRFIDWSNMLGRLLVYTVAVLVSFFGRRIRLFSQRFCVRHLRYDLA